MAKKPPPELFSVEHFLAFAGRLILDTFEPWDVEDFQITMFKPVLNGVRATWNIIPEGNTKTTSSAGFGLYHSMFVRDPWVPIVASSRDQAEILAQQAYGIIRRTPGLEWNPRTHTGYFRIFEGYRQIRNMRDGFRNGRGIKVYAADVGTSDGGIPTLVLCDEGHRWPDLGPFRLWRGKLGKRDGQICMTSTAGEPGTDFEEQRDKLREAATEHRTEGAYGYYEKPGVFVMNEWMVEKPEYADDMERVKDANPFSGITVDSLREEHDDPQVDMGNFRRLKCNLATRPSQSAITEKEWDGARFPGAGRTGPTLREIPEGVRIGCGIDVAWKKDTFALVPCWRYVPSEFDLLDEDLQALLEEVELHEKAFRLLGTPRILTPPRDGSMLHPDRVWEAFNELNDRNPIDVVVIDMERAEDIAHGIEDNYDVEVIDRSQGNALAVEDHDAFMKGLRTGLLMHCGDRGLRKHVMNAIDRRISEGKYRFDRPSQSRAKRKQEQRVIDALTGAAMINWHYDTFEPEGSDPLVSWR